jgi:hypothetical protein
MSVPSTLQPFDWSRTEIVTILERKCSRPRDLAAELWAMLCDVGEWDPMRALEYAIHIRQVCTELVGDGLRCQQLGLRLDNLQMAAPILLEEARRLVKKVSRRAQDLEECQSNLEHNLEAIRPLLAIILENMQKLGEDVDLHSLAVYVSSAFSRDHPDSEDQAADSLHALRKLLERRVIHELSEIVPESILPLSYERLDELVSTLRERKESIGGLMYVPEPAELCYRITIPQLKAYQRASRLLARLSRSQLRQISRALQQLVWVDLELTVANTHLGFSSSNRLAELLKDAAADGLQATPSKEEVKRVARRLAVILWEEELQQVRARS